MPTDNNGAAAPVHPLELALLGLIAAARALRTLLVALLALVLAMAGWRPGANAPIRPVAEQMHQLPPTTLVRSTTTAAALAQLPMAELRAACAAAGCRPGRSRASAVAALLGAAAG